MTLQGLPAAQYFAPGWKIFERNFPLILLLVLLIDLPLEVISYYFGPPAYSGVKGQEIGDLFLAILFVGVSVTVLKNISLTGVVHLAQVSEEERKVSLLEILSFTFTKWWVVALTSLMSLLIVLVLLLLGIIPGIIAMVFLTFNVHAVVVENKGFWSALVYSKEMVKGRWFFVFLNSLAIWLPITVLMGLTSYGSYLLIQSLKLPNYFIPTALTVLIGYYGWVVFTVFYLSLRNKPVSPKPLAI